MPATETKDFEREFDELVQQLRALPTAAPEHVRERVRALGEPVQAPTLWDRMRPASWARATLVLAPACVLALVSAAVIHGVLNSAPERPAAVAPSGQDATRAQTQTAVPESRRAKDEGVLTFGGASVPAPTTTRYQDYEASMTVRVKDLDALSDETNEAMRVVRSYGGYVVSLEQSTAPGKPGRADLVLRVPIARVEDALMRLAALGTVMDRQLSVRDLERVIQQQRDRIVQLKVFIARATERLNGSLPADVRLRLQLQLEEARRDLARTTRANRGTLREAALSRISLTLTTQQAVGAGEKGGMGRAERAARDAAAFLAAAGAVALFLLIVLSPLILLAAAWYWGSRSYRRREERRLLARA